MATHPPQPSPHLVYAKQPRLEKQFGTNAKELKNDIYVDDGLKSMPNSQQAIHLLLHTQAMLATGNLRKHKISSNNPKVMETFPPNDRAAALCDLDNLYDLLWITAPLVIRGKGLLRSMTEHLKRKTA